ncbi:V-type ATP synthase subunit I [Oceanobacter sp. 4_MG-2023]|uniref:V-type ATP synthase subunit I n=1 Tax=Oceanobacter sp. 4_MG-2023 TaxID=3062623 RepID=UPI0027357696|nr:V-type ATP synthase subunit I [Oceanobacter sp. 4_MG-2023]MDP2547399.1 V-type ATP synthase subunit I [Oceanobacter sp. 4_MG-2023]
MTIVALKKVAIAGREKDKEAVIARLQAFGQLHLIDGHESGEEVPEGVRHLNQAIRFLEQGESRRRPLKKFTGFHLQPVVNEAIDVQHQLRQLEDQRDEVQARIQRMLPWGEFHFPDDAWVNHVRLWFYCLPVNKRSWLDRLYKAGAAIRLPDQSQNPDDIHWGIPWQLVGRDSRHLYVVLLSATEPPSACMPVPREHLGSRTLEQLTEALETIEQSLDSLQSRREELTRYLLLLKRHQARTHNHTLWRQVVDRLSSDGQVFTLLAWVPVSSLPALSTLARETGFAFVASDPAADESPPTLLKPLAGFAAGGLLTRFYQLPAYRSWDPSVHLYLSFMVFFAMILSDAGYALALGGLLALRWKAMGKSETGRGLRQLFLSLVGAALVWGVMAGEYFGVELADDNWLTSLVVMDIEDYNTMMKVSILTGVVHLLLANASLAWHRRHEHWFVVSRAGWAGVVLLGCWAGFIGISATVVVLAVVAVLAIMVGSGWARPVSASASPLQRGVQRLLRGLMVLPGLSQLFGDVLSYMRLFALGLASVSLALTFNQLAVQVMATEGGLALLGGVLILLLGHVVNIALGVMSGVVHGLRLNFIEFYNWGEPGEGYAFQPFQLKELEDE